MIPSPIHKVLSSMHASQVPSLLMGGQACVLYGGAEFSRDTDLVILPSEESLDRLQVALDELQAECIAVPPFELSHLEAGHAVHFRCHHPESRRIRIDVMSRLRNVDPFPDLWARRTTFEMDEATIETLSLPDLVRAKKTQRDKDWPMITRLVEANYFANQSDPAPEQIDFWLQELRSPGLLVHVAGRYQEQAAALATQRTVLFAALSGDESRTRQELQAEMQREQDADRIYWAPLKQQLENLRRRRRPEV